jgi:hypothetical protein
VSTDDQVPDDVVVLGAGFSKAVFDGMPLTNALGDEALSRVGRHPLENLQVPGQKFSADYTFESLLSVLAEDQPHLTEAENRANAARFASISEAVGEVLDDAQAAAFAGVAPEWLYELLSVFNLSGTTIITLNYDTIIETAIETHRVATFRPATPEMPKFVPLIRDNVRAADLLRHRPPVPWLLDGGRAGDLQRVARLLKLHGSVDWWWVPGDISGMSLAREGVYGEIGSPARLSASDRGERLPGRERFIVPPMAIKTPYYRNPLTRQLWREAYEAIVGATRLALLGYSLPTTDFVMAGMLRTAIGERGVRLEVIDLDPEGPGERLVSLAQNVDNIDELGGGTALRDYTRRRCDELSKRVVERLSRDPVEQGEESAVLVHWTMRKGSVPRRVFRATGPCHGRVKVETATIDDLGVPDPTPAEGHPTPESLSRLLIDAKRIIAVDGSGKRGTVIATNHGTRWLGLMTAGLF